MVACEHPPNLKRELFDLSIFFEDLPGDSQHINLGGDRIFPVCAPAIQQRLKTPADLAEITCLHDSSWHDDWPTWLAGAVPQQTINTDGPTYSLYSLMLEEAQNGAGVMIAHESLVQPQLKAGTLVAPFDVEVPLDRRLAIATVSPPQSGDLLRKIIDTLIR